MHTVKFTKKAYLVLDAEGNQVADYPFDAFDFEHSRRPAYREALADAAARDEANEAALVTALIEGCDAYGAPQVAELGADAAHAVIEQRSRALFGWSGTARQWLAMREAA